jgi:Protein of unknown function (DUF3363)
MSERGDIIRTMQRAFAREQREYAIVNPTRMSTSIVGRVAFKGLRDELYDRGYIVVDGIDGRAHYVPLARSVDVADLPMEGIVEVQRAANGRAADRTIAALADGGSIRRPSIWFTRDRKLSATMIRKASWKRTFGGSKRCAERVSSSASPREFGRYRMIFRSVVGGTMLSAPMERWLSSARI